MLTYSLGDFGIVVCDTSAVSFNSTKKLLNFCVLIPHVSLCAALKMTGYVYALLQHHLSKEEERLQRETFQNMEINSSLFSF